MNSKIARYLIVVPSIILLICFSGGNIPGASAKSQSKGKTENIEFQTVYPGVYGQYERELVDRIQEYISGDAQELAEKVKAQQAGKKQVGNMRVNHGLPLIENYIPSTEDMLAAAAKLNPVNPLYTDPEYAKKSKYRGLIGVPHLVDIGSAFPLIPRGTEIWVSSDDPAIGRGLDHELTFHKPIYAGDILNSAVTGQYIEDVTDPEGSKVRRIRAIGECALYNQKGEKVMSGRYSCIQSVKVFRDRSMADDYDKPFDIAFYKHYDWDKIRQRHVYTEADWDYIMELWSKEYIRGADTLYWEDVEIGDEPIWTCDGPFTGGFRGTNNEHNIVRDILINRSTKEAEAETYKDSFGIYRLKGAPDNKSLIYDDHPNARSSFMNTIGRNLGTKFVTNWMGDDGWLHKFAWRLAFCWDEGRNQYPEEHDRPSYLLKVPYLKEQGKFLNTHGYDGDIGITKGYVCDKYVKDGAHYVDLVVWCETIDGYIWAECYAVVELPSREKK